MELVAQSQSQARLALYRARQPRKTALYQLVEQYYEDVKAQWEDRFEKKYGRWRGFIDSAAYETVKELMAAAWLEDESFRPGMVSVVQTFGKAARFHPHVHGLCTRGGWNDCGEWMPVPYLDTRRAEELARYRVLRLLKDRELLSRERIELLLSWRRSGFSLDGSVRIPAGE